MWTGAIRKLSDCLSEIFLASFRDHYYWHLWHNSSHLPETFSVITVFAAKIQRWSSVQLATDWHFMLFLNQLITVIIRLVNEIVNGDLAECCCYLLEQDRWYAVPSFLLILLLVLYLMIQRIDLVQRPWAPESHSRLFFTKGGTRHLQRWGRRYASQG